MFLIEFWTNAYSVYQKCNAALKLLINKNLNKDTIIITQEYKNDSMLIEKIENKYAYSIESHSKQLNPLSLIHLLFWVYKHDSKQFELYLYPNSLDTTVVLF